MGGLGPCLTVVAILILLYVDEIALKSDYYGVNQDGCWWQNLGVPEVRMLTWVTRNHSRQRHLKALKSEGFGNQTW